MQHVKFGVCALAGLALCSLLLGGCSGDKDKEGKKPLTVQEQRGRDAAQALQQPVEEARRTAAQVEAKADRALQEVADEAGKGNQAGGAADQSGAKEKKKLEGC